MPHQLHKIVEDLNRLSKLYEYAILFSKPYRIGKLRECYQAMKSEVSMSYKMGSIDSETYKDIFFTSLILEDAARMKREAVNKKEYERAAYYRDLEKRALRNILADFGIDKSDKFFVRNGIIYEIL